MKRSIFSRIPLAAGLAAFALLPAMTLAQTATGSSFVTVATTPATQYGGAYPPVATVTLTGTQPGTTVFVSSLPITLATANGALPTDLSGCAFYNYSVSNNPLMTGANVLANPVAGTNVVTFNTPVEVSFNTPTTLTLRCNVNNPPINGLYTFAAMVPTTVTSGVPNTGTTTTGVPNTGGTPTSPNLGVTLDVFGTMVPGAMNAPIAAITLDPSLSNANLNVSALPVSAAYGNGLVMGDLTSCHWTNALGATVSTVGNTGMIAAGNNAYVTGSPIALPSASAPESLVLNCNVSRAAPIGGTLTLAVTPSAVTTTNAATGTAITPLAGTVNGTSSLSGTITVVPSGGSTSVGATGTTHVGTTAGVPNTGAGGNAATNFAIMGAALLAIVGSAFYARNLFRIA